MKTLELLEQIKENTSNKINNIQQEIKLTNDPDDLTYLLGKLSGLKYGLTDLETVLICLKNETGDTNGRL